jgi:hypothetical protein
LAKGRLLLLPAGGVLLVLVGTIISPSKHGGGKKKERGEQQTHNEIPDQAYEDSSSQQEDRVRVNDAFVLLGVVSRRLTSVSCARSRYSL